MNSGERRPKLNAACAIRSHLFTNGTIDGGFEILSRSKQALAGHTRKIGFVEKGENEPPAAQIYLIGYLILCGKRRLTAVFGVLK
ncbi:hypothetical protein [Neomegalonema perideroedes]|uniref:hypothetical protein n=1 Tax=Neomegalonema perideroedes TaxID=217219 RepID=UPI0012FDFEA4|nr:hypothetical protein [Neomegalonema perideroedes]